MVGCSSCGRAQKPDAVRCLYCGAMLAEAPRCPDCERPLASEGARCMFCGVEASSPEIPTRAALDAALPTVDTAALDGAAAHEPSSPSPMERRVPTRVISAPPDSRLGVFSSSRQRTLVIGAALAAPLALAAICLWAYPRQLGADAVVRARFAPHMERYTRAYPNAASANAYVRGGLLPIGPYDAADVEVTAPGDSEESVRARLRTDEPMWQVHEIYALLPPSLVAEEPEEVGTVARVDCQDQVAGVYVGDDGEETGSAYRQVCALTLVDLEGERTIDERTFPGSDPPSNSSGYLDRRGTDPRPEVVAFLESLPRM